MKIFLTLLALVFGNTAFGYVVTNVGADHQDVLNYNIAYVQSGDSVSAYKCNRFIPLCLVFKSMKASELDAVLAAPGPFSTHGEPIVAEEIRLAYQALLTDTVAHNLRLTPDGLGFEDASVSQDLVLPVLLTATVVN